MKATKILESEIKNISVSSLPSRPTAPISQGGRGYSAAEMKAAFDRLPLFIVQRFNSLIDDIESVGEDSLAAAMKTGIKEGQSLRDFLSDVTDGSLAGYLSVGGKSLETALAEIGERLTRLEEGNEQN